MTGLARFYGLRVIGSNVDSLVMFIVPVLVFQSTGSATWSGLALFLEWVPRLVGLPLAGPLVDRFGVRRTYLVAEMSRVTVALAAVLAVAAGGVALTSASLIAVALVAGLCSDLAFVAGEKAVRVIATPAALPRAQSVLGGIDQTALLAGALIGGLLITFLSAYAIGVVAPLSLAAIGLLLSVGRLPDWDSPGTPLTGLFRPLAAGAGWLARDRIMRSVVAMTMSVNLLAGLTIATAPVILIGHFGHSTAAVSALYVAGAVAALVVLAVTPQVVRTFGLVRVGTVSAIVACAAIAASPVVWSAAGFIALSVCFLALVEMFAVFIRTIRARVVPVAVFGSVSGVVILLNFATFPVAGLLLAAAGRWRLPLVLLYGVTGLVALAAVGWLAVRLTRVAPQWRGVDGHWLEPALDRDDRPEPAVS